VNKSLSALGDVIAALVRRDAHVPYRNSKVHRPPRVSGGGGRRRAAPRRPRARIVVHSLTHATAPPRRAHPAYEGAPALPRRGVQDAARRERVRGPGAPRAQPAQPTLRRQGRELRGRGAAARARARRAAVIKPKVSLANAHCRARITHALARASCVRHHNLLIASPPSIAPSFPRVSISASLYPSCLKTASVSAPVAGPAGSTAAPAGVRESRGAGAHCSGHSAAAPRPISSLPVGRCTPRTDRRAHARTAHHAHTHTHAHTHAQPRTRTHGTPRTHAHTHTHTHTHTFIGRCHQQPARFRVRVRSKLAERQHRRHARILPIKN
jgi:hypothetical protein